MQVRSTKAESSIEERLLTAYKRIRKNARNGLAVVTVQRDACGGCFNQIPPQRQMDIRTRKKLPFANIVVAFWLMPKSTP